MPVINLQKHGAGMQNALKSVRDPKDSTDWALFGYDGKSFDLKVVSTGEDGIEELVEDLNPSKIMYGFIQVKDPKSTLPKYVFLHWQGEGCPVTLKGQASNLLRDVEKYIGSFQITITARNEEEVDIKEIMKQVEKASTSKFSFKTRKEIPKHAIPVTDVKSVYQKVICNKDKSLNMETRNTFWESEEKVKKESQRVVISKNELPSKQDTKSMWKERESEQKKNQNASQNVTKGNNSAKQQTSASQPSMSLKERMKMLEESKVESAPQIEDTKAINKTKTAPVPELPICSKPPAQVVKSQSSEEEEPVIEPDDVAYDEAENDESFYQNEPSDLEGAIYENEPEIAICTFNQDDMYENDPSSQEQADLGVCAVTLYDYEAEDENEITFEPGEVITNIEKPDDNWWQGLNQQGTFGLFPANYVEEIDPSELEIS